MTDPTRIPRAWWWLALALLAGRIALLLYSVRVPEPITGDEPIYVEIARNLLAGRGYWYDDGPWVWKPPGWPITLAGIHATFGSSRAAVTLVQGLFDSGTALLTAWTALRVMGSRLAAAIAFLMVLVWPPFFREARWMQTEPEFTFLVSLTVAAFTRFALKPSALGAGLVGVVAGLASLVRPNGLAPLAGLALGWMLHRLHELKRDVPRFAALALGVALVLAPWTLRNLREFHAFIPVSTGGGELFYMGTTPETDGRWDNTQWATLRGRVLDAEADRLGRDLDRVEVDKALLRAGLDNWKRDFGGSALIALKRVWRLCFLPVISEDRSLVRFGFFVALLALYALALPSGLAGLRAGSGPRTLAGAMLVALAVNVLALSLFYTNSRYFEPVRPLVLILAAGTLAGWLERRATRASV